VSEKLDRQMELLELQIEEGEQLENIENGSIPSKASEQEKPKRQKIPDHLPCTDIILNPEPTCPDCGSKEFRKISDDVSETLEYVPASFKVNRSIRPRCMCKLRESSASVCAFKDN